MEMTITLSNHSRREIMVTVADVLKIKGSQVWTVAPDSTILDALLLMARKNIGALVVEEDGKIAGIVSERDFARHTAANRTGDLITPVCEYMTSSVHTVTPENSIEDCMALMTREHIRHLPVVADDKLAGMISIGDVVKTVIQEKDTMLGNMEELITGRGYVSARIK
jgi:CBS domain-containing protein